jgi:hypothetical protein
MNELVPIGSPALPALAAAGERASARFLEFFAANIRNPHTRWPYHRLPQARRHVRKGCGDGEPCLDAMTELFDRWRNEVSLDEIERIMI